MQKKKLLVAYFGDTPECVEGFPKECDRSCLGALYFKRGKKKTITQEEYEFIKVKYSHMTRNLRLIAEKVVVEPKKKVSPVEKKKVEVTHSVKKESSSKDEAAAKSKKWKDKKR